MTDRPQLEGAPMARLVKQERHTRTLWVMASRGISA